MKKDWIYTCPHCGGKLPKPPEHCPDEPKRDNYKTEIVKSLSKLFEKIILTQKSKADNK